MGITTLDRIEIPQQRFVLLGDLHIDARNSSMLFAEYFELLYEHMFRYMLDHGINTIVQFGDLFDRRKYINFNILKRARENFFDKLREYGFVMYVFLGNHDVSYKNTLEVNSPTLLLAEYGDNVRVITVPTEFQVGGTKYLMLPWICAENYDLSMQAIEETDAAYCFGHLELAGFEMYKGAVCDHGLSPELFRKFKKVYSGHFHHISDNGNIKYIGSPYQIMWSDYGDERGFFIMDDGKDTFVRNPYDMFFKLKYDDSKMSMEDIIANDYSKYSRRYVKIIVQEKNDLFLYDHMIKELENVGAIVTAVDDHKYKNIESDSEIIESAESMNDILRKVSMQYAEVTDSNKLYNLLMDLYTEATNLQVI